MKILLTGATGYLGSHLARALIANGHYVIALKRQTSSLQRLGGIEDQVCFYDVENLDLARPFQERGHIDALVHTAGCYGRAGESASEVFEANVAFPLRLLETAALFNTDIFLNTDTILYPYCNAYSLSKKQFSEWGKQLSTDNKIRFLNIRLEHMYGPDDDSSKFMTWIVEQCAKNTPTIELTAGEQMRDFIHIDDVVEAYMILLQNLGEIDNQYQEIGLGSGSPICLRNLVETVHRISRSSSKLHFGVMPYREHELMKSRADIVYLKLLGWLPKKKLEDGIAAMIKGIDR
jgi:CDP-paratose synthetase